jgi:hypothetical protein
MARTRYALFRDQVRDFYREGWENKVIGVQGNIILVETEIPEEEATNRRPMMLEDPINEPGEC